MLCLSYFRAMLRQLLYIAIVHNVIFSDVTKTIIKNDSEILVIELNISARTEADLYPISLLIGLPNARIPITSIAYESEALISFKTVQEIEPGFDWVNRQKLQ